MDSVEEFLAYPIKLEQEAALRFGELADSMDACGNREVGKLFRQLSEYSKLHLADAMARSGFREIPGEKARRFRVARTGKPGSGCDLGRGPHDRA